MITLIAAVAADGGIGCRGNLLWHIPADLRHFKTLTMGAPVVMGRNTWESLPRRPLPGRRNIVVSRNSSYAPPAPTFSPRLKMPSHRRRPLPTRRAGMYS